MPGRTCLVEFYRLFRLVGVLVGVLVGRLVGVLVGYSLWERYVLVGEWVRLRVSAMTGSMRGCDSCNRTVLSSFVEIYESFFTDVIHCVGIQELKPAMSSETSLKMY